jgi:hypothetical protein
MVAMAEPVTVDLTQLDAFHDLLPALAGSLDIRDVFQRLAEQHHFGKLVINVAGD